MLLILVSPLGVLLLTPFVRPFRLARFVWTYLPPVVPLVGLWDGIVSCLRTYSPEELRSLVAEFQDDSYRWEVGTIKGGLRGPMLTYLVGGPNAGVPDRPLAAAHRVPKEHELGHEDPPG